MRDRRRFLPLAAAALFLGSLLLPYWLLAMKAPTYPTRTLQVRIYATSLHGDVEEWQRVSRLVGIKVPPPLPELQMKIIPAVMGFLGVVSVVAAFRGRAWRVTASAISWLTLLALLGMLQYKLYMVGHDLDLEAPLRHFVKGGFTPPAIGWIRVGKITTYHWPYIGAVVAFLAALLLTLSAFRSVPFRGRRALAGGGEAPGQTQP